MIKRFVLLTGLLATFINSDLVSQSKAENKAKFFEAESFILFEEYKDALPSYQELLQVDTGNYNYKYRIGQCYINIPGEKYKALGYLEDAIKNINPKYKEGKWKERGAPYDAHYYLANAYRINNQLDQAIASYELFKENLDPEVYDSTIVNLQLQSCYNARDLMKMPLYIKEYNLGEMINATTSEYNPVISDNEDLLVFSKNLAFYDAILYSTKSNGVWSGPINMNELLGVDNLLYPTSISSDGKDLYLYSSAEYDGIIYTSHFENGIWSPIIKLNENINTKFWESHATISHDNNKLFFTSNRKGSIGGLDIYISIRDSTGDWGSATNLGPVINTPYNEESPFLSKDDKKLFFSSRGHFNMGGYDIFYSTLLDNNEWSVPLNVGYPLNSTDDDVFFKPLKEGYEGYFAKESSNGFGRQDIYRIEMFSENHPRKFFVRGIVKASDLANFIRDSVKISALNITNPDQTVIVYSNPETGEYELELPHGDYQLTFEAKGAEKTVKNLELPLNAPLDSFILPGTVLPKNDFTADLNVESKQTISVKKGDSILFPMKVEPNSMLTVDHWVGDSLISVEEILISDSTLNYKVAPGVGNNKLVFKLTDKFNNTTTTDVLISREKQIISQPVVRPEYSRIIAAKQIDTLFGMLKNRSNDPASKTLTGADINKQQFGKVDDLISYLREEAASKNISPEDVDKLALRVAVMDNILTQAAVDLLAKNADDDLKQLLNDLDIYESDLKTWNDLQQYILTNSGNQISPEELNKFALNVLSDIDPSIALLREKILAFSENSESGEIIRQSVAAVDLKNIRLAEKWLQEFIKEAINRGLTRSQMAGLLAIISSLPDTVVGQYLKDLVASADEPFSSSLKSLDLEKEKIKSPKDLISFLLSDEEIDRFGEEALSNALVNIIASKNISADSIRSQSESAGKVKLWYLWIITGAGLFLLFILLWRRDKKKDK